MTRSELGKHIMSVGLVGILLALALGSVDTEQDTKKVQSQAPAHRITANALFAEYKANEVAADAKYKGKIVIVSGVIQKIGKDVLDQAYIVIGGKGFLDGVQCTFAESQNASIARLSKGQKVTVKGEVKGKMMGHILVSKCSLQ